MFGFVKWLIGLTALAVTSLGLGACAPKEAVPTSLAAAESRVTSGLKVFKPSGTGPFPTILYFHGASDTSWYPAQEELLQKFTDRGYAAVFVDMYHGRGASGATVRSGNLLPRATAGDVMVAVDWARQQPWVKPGSIGLFGISFGGATIMDAMVLDAPGKTPSSLTAKPSQGLAPVKAAAMLSPWCSGDIMGVNLIKAVHEDFGRQLPLLAVIPTADSVSDVTLCQDILNRNKAKGAPVEVMVVQGAGHTFAQAKDDYGNAFADYDPVKAKQAFERIFAFYDKHL